MKNSDQTIRIKVKSNKKDRTFTLRTYDHKGELIAKYRTFRQNKVEFERMIYNTEEDWKHFFKTNDYYIVKK